MSETVTCIIPVRNGEKTIERAIESAVDAGCDYVLVYDDYSTDSTRQIIDQLTFNYYQLNQLHGFPFRVGVSNARNFLCNLAKDGFIIPLDSDDTLSDIKPLKAACDENTWVYGNYREIDGQNETIIEGGLSIGLTRKNITGVTFMFHKSDWLKVGGYDPDFAFAEDYGFQCALANAGVQPLYVNRTVYNRYLRSEGNERTVLAGVYWDFYHKMAQMKYKNLFAVNR